MVVAVLTLLAILTIRAGDFQFSKKGYMIEVHFQNVDGVTTNSPVMLNGFEVGHVKAIRILEKEDKVFMVLDVWMDQAAKIHDGAQAYVKNMGFLGEKYVGLTSGNPSLPYLQAKAVVIGEEPVDFEKLMRDGRDIAQHIKEISENLNERLTKNEEHIDSIIVNLDETMVNMTSITNNIDERLAINKQHIDDILSNFKDASVNVEELTYDLKINPWKLLYTPKRVKKTE